MLREIRSDEFEIAHRAGFFSSLLVSRAGGFLTQ